MTLDQLTRAFGRFPQLVQLLQQRGLSRAIVDACLVPNRMTLSRWSRGLKAPSEAQLTALVEWAQNRGVDARRIYEGDAQWQAALGKGGDLASLRKSRGLKQSDLAAHFRVSRYTYLLAERDGGELARMARTYLEKLAPLDTSNKVE